MIDDAVVDDALSPNFPLGERGRLMGIALTAVIVVGGLSACGGSDESADSTAEGLTAQIRETCDARASSFAGRGEFPVNAAVADATDALGVPDCGQA